MSNTGKLIAEYAVGAFVFLRDYEEGLFSYDAITKGVLKNTSDPFAIADQTNADVGKGAGSPVSVTGTATKSVEAVRGDALEAADNLGKTFRATRSAFDSMATEESGVAFIQDYAEPGYFLDDYTGESRGW